MKYKLNINRLPLKRTYFDYNVLSQFLLSDAMELRFISSNSELRGLSPSTMVVMSLSKRDSDERFKKALTMLKELNIPIDYKHLIIRKLI